MDSANAAGAGNEINRRWRFSFLEYVDGSTMDDESSESDSAKNYWNKYDAIFQSYHLIVQDDSDDDDDNDEVESPIALFSLSLSILVVSVMYDVPTAL